jgi:hypothetical protein
MEAGQQGTEVVIFCAGRVHITAYGDGGEVSLPSSYREADLALI